MTDNRTGLKYELPIQDNCIRAADLAKIKDLNGTVTRSFDPAYMNTACCVSRISFIDGDNGVLEYRGIPIEVLAEKSNIIETAFLLVYGELPNEAQLDLFQKRIKANSVPNPKINSFI